MKKTIASACAIALFAFSACQKESIPGPSGSSQTTADLVYENGQNPDEDVFKDNASSARKHPGGYVYVESNDASQNSILMYRRHPDGHLSYEGAVASGGAGNGGGLGSQGALVLDRKRDYLYAVNAGDHSVSSFRVGASGSLTLIDTESTGGMMPVSVTTYHHMLYVVNAGSDNIMGFTVSNGMLSPIPGSMQSLSGAGTGAAQISFSHNGQFLYVTEKATDMITAFPVGPQGVAGPGTSIASTGQTPFGFAFARNNYMVVSNAAGGMAGLSTATSYSGTNTGNLGAVNGAVANNQAAACWVAVTRFGRYAFTTNTATDNVSSYYVSPTGALHLVEEDIPSGDGPIDMAFADDNFHAYVLCAADHTIRIYDRQPLGGLGATGSMMNLPAGAAGLAAF